MMALNALERLREITLSNMDRLIVSACAEVLMETAERVRAANNKPNAPVDEHTWKYVVDVLEHEAARLRSVVEGSNE